MNRSAIITFLLGYCAFSFAQDFQFSRVFQAIKSNVPVAIVNTRSGCFYVLRYNKEVHDFTIEKRAKPTAEILAFTPLKLDSVNNSWFDYEKLDYLFFEHRDRLYFLFEKAVNLKKSIFLKVVDTVSKSSGFIELASLEGEGTVKDFSFIFQRANEHDILIVASQAYFNGTTKKTAWLYDIEQRKMVWTKKLPIESAYTGYSSAFECNRSDLFYVLIKSRVIGYRRKYINQMQVNEPVFFHDAINLVSYTGADQPQLLETPLLANIGSINSIHILADEDQITLQASIGLFRTDSTELDLYFFSKKLSPDLSKVYYTTTVPLLDSLKAALTFYDGSDFKSAGNKEYAFLNQFTGGNSNYQISERREDYYYKELLVWQTDLQTGRVTYQGIIPRKVHSFKNRTRFKKIGEAMFVFASDQLNVFVLEAASNFKNSPSAFNYHKFSKETNLWSANIMKYTVSNGQLVKQLVYHNSGFDMVPLSYCSTDISDIVFYLSSGKFEKFAILKLSPL